MHSRGGSSRESLRDRRLGHGSLGDIDGSPRGGSHCSRVIDRLGTCRRKRCASPGLWGGLSHSRRTLASPHWLRGDRRRLVVFRVPFPFEHEVEQRIGLVIPIGALPTEAWPLRIAGNLLVLLPLGLAEGDAWPLALGCIGEEQTARLEPTLVVAEFADIEDVARAEREPVQDRAVAGVRMLAADADIDLAHAVPLPLLDVVDEIELTGFFQEPRIGPDVREDEAAAAVDVADHPEVGIHLRLIERLAAGELELPRDEFALELAVADERHVADGVAWSLVDHECEHGPLAFATVDHLDLAAHLGLEEAEAAVIGSERLDVRVDLRTVQIAADEPEHTGLRLDLREQAGVGGNRVADETGPERLTAAALVDEEHGTLVARLAPFDRGHLRGVIALLVVVRLDPAAGLLDHVGVHRIADAYLRLLADGAGRHALVAHVFDIPQHRPLHHLEDHDNAFFDADVLRVDIDELAAAMERADILLNGLGIEDLACTGDEFGELRHIRRMIAFDPHFDDTVGFVDGRSRLGGGLRQGSDTGWQLGLLAVRGRHPQPHHRDRSRHPRQRQPLAAVARGGLTCDGGQ